VTFVCWRWKPPVGYRSNFEPETVRTLRNMVKRHYKKPHRFLCVTDDPYAVSRIDRTIETLPLWQDYADLPSPHGGHNPSCYRRLRLFAPDAAQVFGDTEVVSLDLDTIIVRDVTPVFDRSEDFVAFGETDPRSFYNGSFLRLRLGTRPQVWERFVADPEGLRRDAKAAGRFGSDQGIISYVLGPGEAIWRPSDGVYSFRVHLRSGGQTLPSNARLVAFHGAIDPWSARAQRLDWVRRHYQ
jgi:hypothetical protein